LILNELNAKNSVILVIASKNWTLNAAAAAAAARKKFDGGLTGLSTTSTPRKFDSVSRRNSTAPGSKMAIVYRFEFSKFKMCGV